jgi:ABC-2 type transport system ATP-binding protein
MIFALALIPLFLFSGFYIGFKKPKYAALSLKIGAGILAIIYFFRLFSLDYFEELSNAQTVIPHSFLRILYVLLRAYTSGTILVTLVTPFFNNRTFSLILSRFVPIVAIINFILIKLNGQAFLGPSFSWANLRMFQFGLEQGLLLSIGCLAFLTYRFEKEDLTAKRIAKAFGIFSLTTLLVMPLFTFRGIFGPLGQTPKDFNLLHRMVLYFCFLAPAVLYIVFRSKPYEDRYLLTVLIAVAGIFTYFNNYEFASFTILTKWPLHLCNTAILLMFIAFVFRSKTFFYFNYFINVIGALIALVIPSISSDFFSVTSMHYWINHFYAFMLPLLGVALHIFPRPNFKLITTSIGVFSIYFVVVAFINSWFYNYDKGVNYFFLNDDFLAKKFGILKTLRFNGIYDIPMGNLTFRVYPWYWLGIYIGFIFLTFATWFVYDALYKVSDHHYDWHVRKVRQKLIGAGAISLSIEEIYAMQEVNSSIKISHFSKIYGKNKTKAVDDFSLEVHQGEIFGFLGHNGAGKSTVIKSLVGIQSITEGTIEVCGFDIQKNPLQAKLMIGYVPDNHAVYERLTGREYVSYIADLFLVSTEDRKTRLEKYAKMFGLEEALDKQIKTYSHGMKQKISVIASLIHNPKVWVLDEPLTGLDPTSAYQIKECMKEHAKAGNIVFFSSHVIEVVENICDRIAVIKKGHLVTIESIRDLKARGISLESIYLKYVGDINLLEGEPNVS